MNYEYFESATSFDSLRKGLGKCCNGVRWKDSVVGYELHAMQHTSELHRDILCGNYKIQPYQKFVIYEPKTREISATRIRDRQVQRALCDGGLYQDFVEHFIHDNCACQNGKGTDFAIKRMKTHMRRYYQKYGDSGWVLKCDIEKFFPSTRHGVAKSAVNKVISDGRAKEVVHAVIDSFGGDIGIGLGSQFSQLVELAVLNDLDHFVKERLGIKFYIRYMDDFILVHPDKDYIRKCKTEIEMFLNRIHLNLNKKTNIHPVKQGIKFIQWRFFYTETGKIKMHLNRKKLSKQRKKLRKLLQKENLGKVEKQTAKKSLQSWIANAERGDTYFQVKSMKRFYNKEVARWLQ